MQQHRGVSASGRIHVVRSSPPYPSTRPNVKGFPVRYDQGWVKLYRSGSAGYKQAAFFHGDGLLWAMWTTLISWANHEDGYTYSHGQRVDIKRGDVWTSIPELQARLGMTEKEVRNRLKKLETGHKAVIQTGRRGTMVTLLNYDEYQSNEKDKVRPNGEDGAQKGQDKGGIGAESGQRSEEVKKPRKKERKKERVATTPFGDGTPVEPAGSTPVGEVWQAYAEAYATRYRAPDGQGIRPVWNARVGGQMTQLIARIGLDRAIELVRFYVAHNKASYINYSHPIGFCLQDAEGLCTQMARGSATTESQGRAMDRTASNLQNAQAVLRDLGITKEG